MDCSTPGLPVPHYLQEFAQVHVRWVGDAIQPSHSIVCVCVCVHSSADGHLGCLHILAIVNKAATNIEGVCIFINDNFVWI